MVTCHLVPLPPEMSVRAREPKVEGAATVNLTSVAAELVSTVTVIGWVVPVPAEVLTISGSTASDVISKVAGADAAASGTSWMLGTRVLVFSYK
jgi:hypothetical protein